MTAAMSPDMDNESIHKPTSLHEAINIIKFLTTTHKLEIAKWKESNLKQAQIIKKLESNRKKELAFLSTELHNYEINLAQRTDSVSRQLAEKDGIIKKQSEIIEDLTNQLKQLKDLGKTSEEFSSPKIILSVDSNSDSGIAMENDEIVKNVGEPTKPEIKIRKCRRFADSISFLRRVDFSPIKYKPCNRDTPNKVKKDPDSRKNSLEVPYSDFKRVERLPSIDRILSDNERSISNDPVFSDGTLEPIVLRPKKMNDSMNNHFSDDGSEDTSEEVFDRVMTRSSLRRSIKANPKYKKINRTKSKLLEQVKINIVD